MASASPVKAAIRSREIPTLDIRISIFSRLGGASHPRRAGHQSSASLAGSPHRDGTLLFGVAWRRKAIAINADMQSTFAKIADDFARKHFMRKLLISEMAFFIHDEVTGNDWSVKVPSVEVARGITGEIAGEAKVEVTQKDSTALVVVHYDHTTGKKPHKLTARLSGINPAFLLGAKSKAAIFNLPITGQASVTLNKGFEPVYAEADLHGDAGTLDDPDFWDGPRAG